jgi:hypothetical protein
VRAIPELGPEAVSLQFGNARHVRRFTGRTGAHILLLKKGTAHEIPSLVSIFGPLPTIFRAGARLCMISSNLTNLSSGHP